MDFGVVMGSDLYISLFFSFIIKYILPILFIITFIILILINNKLKKIKIYLYHLITAKENK